MCLVSTVLFSMHKPTVKFKKPHESEIVKRIIDGFNRKPESIDDVKGYCIYIRKNADVLDVMEVIVHYHTFEKYANKFGQVNFTKELYLLTRLYNRVTAPAPVFLPKLILHPIVDLTLDPMVDLDPMG